jgi:hypothetical protein
VRVEIRPGIYLVERQWVNGADGQECEWCAFPFSGPCGCGDPPCPDCQPILLIEDALFFCGERCYRAWLERKQELAKHQDETLRTKWGES